MLLIYRDFEGNLPFTGIIREVYGLPYATSTQLLILTPSVNAGRASAHTRMPPLNNSAQSSHNTVYRIIFAMCRIIFSIQHFRKVWRKFHKWSWSFDVAVISEEIPPQFRLFLPHYADWGVTNQS